MTDEEALIQLIIGNIQTENHPLEIGLNALFYTGSYGQNGKSSKRGYAQKIGLHENSIKRYYRAAEVYQYLTQKVTTGGHFLQEITALEEISKLPQHDWCWLHDFIVKHECSKQQVIAIVKAVKSFRT